ncbi:RING finger protein 146 [Trichuris trichiura]|uniref:E3 ubiquitin-protein ligase n=1 Tax=Trichuris trichiura TaxID=36087 RepID=A0A077Z682_TRITR|nr:RING finger protein 146 [Trichuris trichiura]
MDAAESSQEKSNNECDDVGILVCPVCLCPQYFPVVLPCSHMFCFLCIKGAAVSSGYKCPLCRSRFPIDCISNPKVYCPSSNYNSCTDEELSKEGTSATAWFYEGRDGWWRYDAASNCQLEDAYTKGLQSLELLIAGQIYIISLVDMEQYPRHEPAKKRRVKRDLVSSASKGIAGVNFVATSWIE